MPKPAEIGAIAEDCFNRRDLDGLLALWNEDIDFEGPAATFTGRDGMAAQDQNLWTAFPDIRNEVHTFAADDDHTVLTIRFRGTHDGPLRMGGGTTLPATGRSLDFTLSAHITMQEGRIASERVFYDSAHVLRQLGALAG